MSRPYTSRSLQLPQLVPRHIELCGFTQDQIRSCITNEYSSAEDAEKLIRLLNVRTDIFKLCYIPNNLSIVMHIFRTSRNNLPNTLTALYELYIHSAKVRYVQNQYSDPEAALGLENESQFPPTVKELLSSLCMVAFTGLQRNKFVIKEGEIMEINRMLAEGVNTMGLMTAYKSFTPTAIVKSFQFVHGTIQEFLASKALSTFPVNQQQEFILNCINNTHYQMMLTFIAGQAPLTLLKTIARVPLSYEGSLNIHRLFLLLHMVYEAQSPELCKEFAKSFPDGSLMLSRLITMDIHTINDFDIHMLQYLLQHSGVHWKMIECHEIPLEKVMSPLTSSSFDLCIKELQTNVFTSESVYTCLAHTSFQGLKALKVALHCPLSEEASSIIAGLHNLSHLHFECLSQASLDSAMEVSSKCQHLQYLGIQAMKTKDKIICLSLSLPIPTKRADSFSLQCEGLNITSAFIDLLSYELGASQNIKQLYSDECTFNSEQLCSLFKSAMSNCTIDTFHLSRAYSLKWTVDTVSSLKEMISQNSSLKSITLSHCNIDAAVATGIAEALKRNQKLTSLSLASNRHSDKIDAVLNSINEAHLCVARNSFLQVLNLSECGLKGHMKLLASLISSASCVIKELDISYNGIDEDGGNTLFAALSNNSTVRVLKMKGNPLWLKDGTVLHKMITENTVLRELLLENCGLHISAIERLADGVSRNSTLLTLHLGVSLKQTPMEGACSISIAVGSNSTLQKLSLSAYVLGDEGTEALARALKHNATLVSLHLHRCKFGSPTSLRLLIDVLYSHQSLQEVMLPSINGVLQQVFLHHDRINRHRAMNRLPYIRLIESGPHMNVNKLLTC